MLFIIVIRCYVKKEKKSRVNCSTSNNDVGK